MLDLDEREQALYDIREEINVVLSIKDFISEEEVNNFIDDFQMLTEREIREQIAEITGNSTYLDNYSSEKELPKYNEIIVDDKNILEQIELNEDLDLIKTEDNINEYSINENNINENSISKDNINENNTSTNNINAENIALIREEIKYNQLCIDWDWPIGIKKVLVCYRNDKFPLNAEDKDCNKFTVEKNLEEKTGEFIIKKLKEESYYFSVFPMINDGSNIVYLQGKKRLVVNKSIGEIYYELKVRKSLLGLIKSVKLVLKTNEEELTLPPTVLVSKKGNIPIFKSDGNEVYKFDYIKIGNANIVEVEVPIDRVSKNTYVKLFIEDEKNSHLFRIIPPKKEKMYL